MDATSPAPGSVTGFDWSRDWGRRLGLVLGLLLVTRLGILVPLPGLDPDTLSRVPIGGSGAWVRLSLFGLGLTPFVTAWVLMEIFRGNRAERDVARTRRWLTAAFAAFQGWGVASGIEGVRDLVPEPGLLFRLTVMLSLTGGTMLLVWLGERITRLGFCDGIWLIVATSTIAELPGLVAQVTALTDSTGAAPEVIALGLAVPLALVVLIVAVELARRGVGVASTASAGSPPQSSTLWLKLDPVTVLPAYLANFVLMLPVMLLGPPFSRGQPFYVAIYAALLILATYLAIAAVASPKSISDRLRREWVSIAGVPAWQSESVLDVIMTRLAAVTALYLVVVCALPEAMPWLFGLPFSVGGPSLLIVVIVMLDILSRARGAEAADTGR